MVAMSHRHVQAAAVLLHWHPIWRERLLHGDVPGLPLTHTQRQQLAAIDARAFRADDDRVARVVTHLSAEFPVSVAMVGVPTLFALFQHDDVVAAVVPGGRLFEVTAKWLQRHGATTAALELATAQARRRRPKPARGWQTAAGVAVATVPVGTVARYTDAVTQLGPNPVTSIINGSRITPPSQTHDATEAVLITITNDVAAIATCTHALAAILSFLVDDHSTSEACSEAQRLGADGQNEAMELLYELRSDGLLSHEPPN
jgi:hypothetical protein